MSLIFCNNLNFTSKMLPQQFLCHIFRLYCRLLSILKAVSFFISSLLYFCFCDFVCLTVWLFVFFIVCLLSLFVYCVSFYLMSSSSYRVLIKICTSRDVMVKPCNISISISRIRCKTIII